MSDFTTDAARATALGRVLGARLRHLRIDAGASLAAVARRLGVSRHSIGQIERGLHSPRKNQIARLLAHYQVPDDEQRATAELLGQDQTGEGQHQVADALPGWLTRATGVERTSSHLHAYALHHFPAPVQTPEYARALASTAYPERSLTDNADQILLRVDRARLHKLSPRATCVVIIDEALLLRAPADAAVHRRQLQHLHALTADNHNVHIGIRRLSAPAPIPLPSHGSVTYCTRGRGPDDDLVLSETLHGARYFADDQAAEYRETLFQLTRAATDRPKTLAILQRHIDHLPAPARI
ncbi:MULTISPECIES: Scr1 family TA system antitoxin-like transcriptional regulator [Streptomyces]|uniref:Helix-turn-helix domain-containing protein n=1 Tax=Streptomyces griseus TaxID=1911 RepID=A0A380P965_STRGR|nr:Scr1 family TA system antitoxin-like transcriptional regulator [Streptomyces griseus]NEE50781.1 helix-turn-helix domain-containing protein [Streptomyces sp. SID8455]SUP61753.1 helix-turn-helix domain-containing protein [Streptomyces griseus]